MGKDSGLRVECGDRFSVCVYAPTQTIRVDPLYVVPLNNLGCWVNLVALVLLLVSVLAR